MKSISGKQLCKIVEQRGWTLQRITGSHHIPSPEVKFSRWKNFTSGLGKGLFMKILKVQKFYPFLFTAIKI